MEIALLLGVLVLFFGAAPSSRLLGRLFATYRKVDGARRQLDVSPRNLLMKAFKGPPEPPVEK